MPQETNLNVFPYYDDFDSGKDYYKVLFKPGYPIQARELNNLQSGIQNQIEKFGQNIFKDGSRVSGAEWKYDNPVSCILVEDQFSGIPLSLYFDQLIGKKIRGLSSGVSARVVYILDKNDSQLSNYTIYLQYLQSGGDQLTNRFFQDGEIIVTEDLIVYGNSSIQPGQGLCTTITSNSNSTGSIFSISKGVYFINGIFTNVKEQSIILDQYGTIPSYRVGFDVIESIVNSDQDETLVDNAQGFNNYAAPGADRFKVELQLSKKEISDLEAENFVEIFRVENGVPTFLDIDPQYNLIRDYIAKRTFDESGNFFVKPFTLFVRDSLNDRVLNNGLYFEDQITVSGSTPSEDVMVYQIGPGKAYVNGYDVEVPSVRLLESPKPRQTETKSNQLVTHNSGSLVILNRVYGGLPTGFGTDSIVSLIDSRIGLSSSASGGTTIGIARVYDLIPESDYNNNTSRFELRLFDIETYTQIGLSTSFSTSVSSSTFIEGKRSNASGFVRSTVSAGSTILTLYEVSGSFLENEPIIVNGIDDGRLINYVRDYSISDVKSIYSSSGFNADVVLDKRSYIAKPGTTFRITNGVVSAGLENNFINVLKPGDIISYTSTTFTGDPIYNKVLSVGSGGTNFTITGITTVSGICNGILQSGTFDVNNIIKLSSSLDSTNSSLLTRLPNDNIESIQFEEGKILQRRTFLPNGNGTFSNGVINISIPSSDTDIFFESFDEDRYFIYYINGAIENVRRDKFGISPDGKTVTFLDLSVQSGTARVIATVKNLRASSKIKKINTVSSLIVNKSKFTSSGIGTTTLNDGLTYSKLYGLRVQDKEISLNIPDVIRVIAIYESNDVNDPQLPTISFNGTSGNTNTNQDFNIGEWIIGKNTGAVGIVVSRNGTNGIEYVYLNTFQFSVGEVIEGKDSKTTTTIIDLTVGGKNITKNYLLDDGQRDTYYDFSRIIRKKNVEEPTKKLKIIFQNYTIDSSDTGEFITVNSYSKERFKNDVLYFKNSRLTDYIDIRPRVAPYTSSEKSPFEFDSRKFDSDGQYSKYIMVPGENIVTTYSYYVSRIDRVFLNTDGTFEISQGIPNSLVPPPLKENCIDIATVYIPPYVYDVKNVNVEMSKYKRYRMQDISLLEDRIERVEKFTTLSMLESKTENFTIRDAETGLDRFKCGFFVDNFSTHEYHDIQNPSFRAAIDQSSNTLRPQHYTTSLDLQLGSEAISGIARTFAPNADQSYVSDLGSPGIRKTGDLITLNYNEVLYFEQPYATKTESITPFLVSYWLGNISLNPSIDSWVEERKFTTTNFNEVVTELDPIPDQNITIVRNVVVNNEVWTNPPINQSGISPNEWFTNSIRIAERLIPRLGREALRNFGFNNLFNVQFLNNGVNINARRSLNNASIEFIRSILPSDVANNFITATQSIVSNTNRAGTVSGITLDFRPGTPPNIVESRNTTTTTQSTSNVSTIIIPPEIITRTSTNESTSNYTETIRYLRSRNIEFDAKSLKPRTRFYPFFEGVSVKNYIIPKLLEIEMISGVFQIGETVESDPHFSTNKIKFRLCKPNHRSGPFDGSSPTLVEKPAGVLVDFASGKLLPTVSESEYIPDVYKLNPYTQQVMPDFYSESSTILNVDTRSLQLPSETNYFGLVSPNMRLIGKKSGAVARITNIRLVSDNFGRLIGSLFIPDPNIRGNPQWINGENTFLLTDIESLNQIQSQEFSSNNGINQSSAEAEFSSSGITNITETKILSTRNVTIIPSRRINTTTITNTTTNTTTVTQTQVGGTPTSQIRTQTRAADPLAQSFYVEEDTGIFVTSVEVFFETKDEELPVTLQLRPITNGVPSNVVVPFSEVTLDPDEVKLSVNGSVATRFTFPSPVYLPGPSQLEIRQSPIGSQQTSEFAIVLLSQSPQYRVFISELGSNDILTGVKLSAQPTLGSLFKSQNGNTWNPSQLEDLKFRLNRANFVNDGIVRFFNPRLSLKNKKVTVTGENQITPLSKRTIVGLGSTGYNSNVVPGVTLIQGSASGELIGIAGSIRTGANAGAIVSNPGFGYTQGTFNGVELKTETGIGKGAVATIGVDNGGINSVTITNGGFGYQVGDSLLIPETGMGQNIGFGGKLTVSSISSNNTFIIDKVQGTFTSGINTVFYLNSAGTATSIGNGVNITDIFEDPYYDGLHMKVLHMNHGMHSTENYVKIESMRPLQNEVNSKTTTEITSSSTLIPLVSSVGFETFEGLPVSSSNPGYAIIGNEIIKYTVSGNSLLIIERQIDNTELQSYDSGVPVYKYEFNGISLRRINKIHNFADVEIEDHPIGLNSYFIKIDNSGSDNRGTNRSNDLFFKETVQTGRSGTVISNNIQFESITPNISNIIPAKTNLSSRVRTFTGTSIGGNEKSFVDDGFTSIPLNDTTYFANPKIICSEVNEERFINESPGNRSFTMEFLMTTSDPRVSPVIDTIRTSVVLTTNLINNPLGIGEESNYANDDKVRSLIGDPHATIYISKPVRLKLPANSLKVLFSASRNNTNDIRVLYQLFRDDSAESSNNFELFPGYSNYKVDNLGIKRTIDPSLNDGSADVNAKQSSDRSFRDYEYSVDDLPDFNAFAIKIVMSGSNQATPPLIKELRTIATIKPKV